MKNLICILSVVFAGCSSSSVNDELKLENIEENLIDTSEAVAVVRKESIADQTGFNAFYNHFTAAIITKDTIAFNTFIHQDYGIHFIEASGAMPMFLKVYDITDFKDVNTQKDFFELKFNRIEQMPINDSLPKVICAGEVYDKYGCFVQESNPLNKTQIWNYTDLTDKLKQEIEVIAKTITHTVVNTANYTFYFSLIDNKWFVTFIDIRTPCSA